MSGGSQHNPNGRQSQLGAGWSPLQLQVANLLARAPQAHMASERGLTWHTPTPPPHLYHVPAPSPPDPLQAMKGANSVFRHTATPPELFRHTPTPPDKHLLRHTPSPGDVKAGGNLPPADLYPHLGPGREKILRADELLAYARGGVDLTVGSRGSNGSPTIHPAPALSVRDAPTINSLLARTRPAHARVDSLLERLSAAPPVSPHSVIVHPRAAPTPSPPSSNEDSADSCGAPPGSKRKRKPERTIRVPVPPPPPAEVPRPATPPRVSPIPAQPLENGVMGHTTQNGPEKPPTPQPPEPHARRKTRSGSAETIDDIAAMIASTDSEPRDPVPEPAPLPEPEAPVTVDKLKSVLASPEPEVKPPPPPAQNCPQVCPQPEQKSPKKSPKKEEPEAPPSTAAAPRRRSARTSNTESANVPVESPSEAKPAEPESTEARSAVPTAASFVEVENQLEKMFAGLEEEAPAGTEQTEKASEKKQTAKARKRRKSAPTKGERKASKRASRASTGDEAPRRKTARKKVEKKKKEGSVRDAYDSGSNASSSRSRGPYIQIVGPRDSPVSVSVVNAGAEEERRAADDWRNGLRARGLHASTLGLRYDASTPDASWLCAFCDRGPHHAGLGDLFGPYPIDVNSEDYGSLDESSKSRFASSSGGAEVWFHEACGAWAPGLLAAGARLWGLAGAVCGARGLRCGSCARPGAALACAARACQAATHYPCAASWKLMDDFRAFCPRHA